MELYDGLRVEGGREGDAGTGPGGGDMVLLGGEGLEPAEGFIAEVLAGLAFAVEEEEGYDGVDDDDVLHGAAETLDAGGRGGAEGVAGVPVRGGGDGEEVLDVPNGGSLEDGGEKGVEAGYEGGEEG